MFVITPTSGRAISRELARSGPGRASPSRAPALACPARPRAPSAAGRSRCCSSRGCAWTRRRTRAQQRGEDVLGRGLAGRAGDADDPAARARAAASHARARRAERRAAGRRPRAPARARSLARPRAARARRDDHAPGAALDRLPRELAAVDALARDAEEQVARPRPARESTTARAGGRRGPPAGPPSASAAPATRAIRRSESITRGSSRPSARSSSRATSRSSNGILRPSSNSCPCSWPLPAIMTMSPGSRDAERALDRRAAVGLDLERGPSRAGACSAPATIAAMIASRVLGARVVRGDDHVVGERGRRGAHQRPLVAVAVAAGAEDADQRRARRSSSSRAARSTFSSESGVCA